MAEGSHCAHLAGDHGDEAYRVAIPLPGCVGSYPWRILLSRSCCLRPALIASRSPWVRDPGTIPERALPERERPPEPVSRATAIGFR